MAALAAGEPMIMTEEGPAQCLLLKRDLFLFVIVSGFKGPTHTLSGRSQRPLNSLSPVLPLLPSDCALPASKTHSTGFCVIWVCISSNSSSIFLFFAGQRTLLIFKISPSFEFEFEEPEPQGARTHLGGGG